MTMYLIAGQAFWEINLNGIGVNGVELASGSVTSIVDTGSSSY